MNDKNKILIGLLVFVVIVTFPFWYTIGNIVQPPNPELTTKAKTAKQCILPAGTMASEHMQLLDLWRHSVVRNAERIFVKDDGSEYEMSISNTCLDCHSNKADFCDKCHTYASVEPYCWNCHIDSPIKGGDKE